MKAIIHENDVDPLKTAFRFCIKNVGLLTNEEKAAMARLGWQLEHRREPPAPAAEPVEGRPGA